MYTPTVDEVVVVVEVIVVVILLIPLLSELDVKMLEDADGTDAADVALVSKLLE